MVGNAAVAAGNADTAAAAAAMLRSGGNAVDAALAAGFAAAVTEPCLSSLGGGGFLLAATPDGQRRLFDFFVDAPGHGRPPDLLAPHFLPVTVRFGGAHQVFHAGWGSVAVPGCLDGYVEVHGRLGRLSLADVVAPAMVLAEHGTVLDAAQGALLGLLEEILTLSPEGRAIFAPRGRPLEAGERMHNEALAALLRQVADGRVRSFADPSLAGPLETAMTAGGGLVTSADLSLYAVHERDPLRLAYRGGEVVTNPAPSVGGGLVGEALADLDRQGRLDESPEAYRRLASALVRMSERHLTGPQAVRGTTHVSVVDAEGNLAAMTTSNGSCSGQFVPGTGVQLNNVMGEADLHPEGFHATAPGTRIGSMMAPTVITTAEGTLIGVGSGGSERIRSALTCVLSGLLDRDLPVEAAVAAPRLHWDRHLLHVEPGLPSEVLTELGRHWPVHGWDRCDLYFGGAHAVTRTSDGTVSAAGDSRRGGAVQLIDAPRRTRPGGR
jgi:gamma-glutamyltranspeptidase/glutathione hydrolase